MSNDVSNDYYYIYRLVVAMVLFTPLVKLGWFTLFAVVVFLYTSMFVDIYHTYGSPHIRFSESNAYNISVQLLDCIYHKDGQEHWNVIKQCLKEAVVYSVRNGRVPYAIMHNAPNSEAWVQPKLSSTAVFATSRLRRSPVLYRALVMIHECSHLSLGTKDVAYLYQEHFGNLTTEEHANNADSYVFDVYQACINDDA
tara:strand:+ start:1280 stop:1870 length:591 start_codon:yes stop_codon:yes gene_type:complete